jgi:hypothetical protein
MRALSWNGSESQAHYASSVGTDQIRKMGLRPELHDVGPVLGVLGRN